MGPQTLVRMGLFRSLLDDRIGAANLYAAFLLALRLTPRAALQESTATA